MGPVAVLVFFKVLLLKPTWLKLYRDIRWNEINTCYVYRAVTVLH